MKRTNMNYIRTDARKLVIFARVPVIFVRWRSQRTNMTGHCDARRRKNTAFSCVSGKNLVIFTFFLFAVEKIIFFLCSNPTCR